MRFNRKKEPKNLILSTDWRTYQSRLQGRDRRRNTRNRILIGLAAALLIVSSGYMIHRGLDAAARLLPESPQAEPQKPSKKLWDRNRLHTLLQGESFINRTRSEFEVHQGSHRYTGKTTLDPQLQEELVSELNTWMAKERYRSRYVGVVVLDPRRGDILGFVGHDKLAQNANPCLNSEFPAASIFKIVTAAAAIEAGRMTQGTQLSYNGRPHTLYKSQLKKTQNKYTRYITLKDAFAKSVNPVFGKLGVHTLGRENLERYAAVFAFNQSIPWELPLPPSRFTINDEQYHWAELASGFNQDTTLSPLHGALITAALVNQGVLLMPNLVASLEDEAGHVVYHAQPSPLKQAIAPATAQMLKAMMEATITSGTGRKTFRGYRKDAVLRQLRLGGKTGTINNDPRYDWYVGFAEDQKGTEQLVVAALVAHEKYIGQRAALYAKLAIKSHFSRYFARQEAAPAPRSSSPPAE